MSTQAVLGAIALLAGVCAVIFGWVALHEFMYASDHPFEYGPAKVIAWSGIGGTLLSLAVGSLAVLVMRRDSAE